MNEAKRIDPTGLTFKEDSHYNAKEWFGYGYTCVQHPGLTLIKRFNRKTKQITCGWRFGGTEYPQAQDAIAALEQTL